MTITPPELLDTSIAQLQTLVAFLDDQLSWTKPAAPEARACKEISRSLRILIRMHQATGGMEKWPLGSRLGQFWDSAAVTLRDIK